MASVQLGWLVVGLTCQACSKSSVSWPGLAPDMVTCCRMLHHESIVASMFSRRLTVNRMMAFPDFTHFLTSLLYFQQSFGFLNKALTFIALIA